jgi:hypothetical protein
MDGQVYKRALKNRTDIILCSIIAGIANKKGAHGYFWISLIFSPLMGAIMAAAEPDRGTKK